MALELSDAQLEERFRKAISDDQTPGRVRLFLEVALGCILGYVEKPNPSTADELVGWLGRQMSCTSAQATQAIIGAFKALLSDDEQIEVANDLLSDGGEPTMPQEVIEYLERVRDRRKPAQA